MDKTKIPEAVTIALNAIKDFAKYLFIPTAAVAFSPDAWLQHMRLLEFKNHYGHWVAVVFWITFAIIIIDLISKLISKISNKLELKKFIQRKEKQFELLNKSELKIIALIYCNDTYIFELNDSSIVALKSMDMIVSPNISQGMVSFSFTLQPWVRKFLKRNPQIVGDFIKQRKKQIYADISTLKADFHQWEYNYQVKSKIEELEQELNELEYPILIKKEEAAPNE